MTTPPVRVLFADDDDGLRAMMRAALRKQGLEVTLARDGTEALQAYHDARQDIVLLDVDMPGISGHDVCCALRREAGALLPIVMVTGMDDVRSVERAYESGATDFISKPINWAQLGHRVRHLIRNSRTQLELRRAEERALGILEALPDVLFELDQEGRFLDYHAAGSAERDARMRALLGRTIAEALEPALAAVAQSALLEAAETGRSMGKEYCLPLRDGQRWYELSVARKCGDGVAPRFFALSRDITARKRAERQVGELALSLQQTNLELRNANEELQRRAFEDPLCGLPNRALFDDRLQHALQRHARVAAGMQDGAAVARIAVLFIDLDGFKPINDSFGHSAGDAVLREAARRLHAAVRDCDTLARLGGDEFVALIESDEAERDALHLGRHIIEALRRPFSIVEQTVSLSCSIGIVVYPDCEASGQRLLACADAAMYAAKRMGGGACVLYEPGMLADETEQLLMVQGLRESLSRGELTLHYQPKVDSRHGRVHELEALLRWKHERFGQVSPAVFIPLAERHRLIGAIGNRVIDQACGQLAAWHAQGLPCRMAVNLSPHQLRQVDLAERIEGALRRHRLHASQLVCEITESAMMEHTQDERSMLDRIAALGVCLSIDDFGTGYSAMAHLRRIPARQLKIDRSFVTDLADSAQARAMLEAIVRLAHALRMEVVAEGVETGYQLQTLRELGCDLLQGHYIAPPMCAEAVPGWIAARGGTNPMSMPRCER